MSQFIGYTIGLECNGHGKVGRMVKVAYTRLKDGRVELQATDGRSLASLRGVCTISQEEFEERPSDACDSVPEARWALRMVGWSLMAEDAQESHT